MNLAFDNSPYTTCTKLVVNSLITILWLAIGVEAVIGLQSHSISFQWNEVAKDSFFAVIVTGAALFFYKRYRIQVRDAAKEKAMFFTQNPHPMWIYNLKTLRFLDVNEAAVALYGYTKKEFLAITISDIRLKDDVPALISSVDKIKLNFNLNYHWSGTWRHQKKNRELIYVEISSHEIMLNGENAELVLAYNVTDKVEQDLKLQEMNFDLERKVTSRTNDLLHLNHTLVNQNKIIKSANLELYTLSNQLQEASEKIREHAEQKSKFVSIASHEFRIPLANIKGSAEFISRHYLRASPEKIIAKAYAIEKQADYMIDLMNDVLTVGKTDAPRLEAKCERVDLYHLLAKIAREVECANKNSHEIHLTFDKRIPSQINTDEKLLRNIFINLLNNAVKYSPGSKVIHFEIYCNDQEIYFHVKDHGIGINVQEVNKIFEPFYRVSTTNSIQGTGLGLFIVKRAAGLINARIKVESEPGKGSVFTVILPSS